MELRSMDARIVNWLTLPGAAFAVGAQGAIAEFRDVAGDPPLQRLELGLVSARGALRLQALAPASLRIESHAATPAGDPHGHESEGRHGDTPDDAAFITHDVVVDASAAALGGRRAITDLGADLDAVQPQHRELRLFDLGLGLPHVDACVRTAEPALIRALQSCAGQHVLDPGCEAMAAIKSASPHRVFRSVLARIEVYQPIPSRARGERTPRGPHTHVLPGLLRRNPASAAQRCVLQCFEVNPSIR
jgi:hypothetical protein